MAAENNSKDVAELLIRSGADINAKDKVITTRHQYDISITYSTFIAIIAQAVHIPAFSRSILGRVKVRKKTLLF